MRHIITRPTSFAIYNNCKKHKQRTSPSAKVRQNVLVVCVFPWVVPQWVDQVNRLMKPPRLTLKKEAQPYQMPGALCHGVDVECRWLLFYNQIVLSQVRMSRFLFNALSNNQLVWATTRDIPNQTSGDGGGVPSLSPLLSSVLITAPPSPDAASSSHFAWAIFDWHSAALTFSSSEEVEGGYTYTHN